MPDHVSREREDEEELPELRRLELEGAEGEPALRPSGGLAEEGDEQEEEDRQAEERVGQGGDAAVPDSYNFV